MKTLYILLSLLICVLIIGGIFVVYYLKKNKSKFKARKGGWRDPLKYIDGVGFGGQFLMEMWMFPNIALGGGTEWDYIQNMVKYLGPENAIQTMHNHYKNYITDSDLQKLADMGIGDVRIAVGWWLFESPVSGPGGRLSGGKNKCIEIKPQKGATMYDKGFSPGGMVTGGIVYLEELIKKLKQLKITAFIDIHAHPGGAQSPSAYQGDSYDFDMWCGIDDCSGKDYAKWARRNVLKCAEWIKGLEDDEDTSGVIWAIELVNEPQLGGQDWTQCRDKSGRQVGDAMVEWFQKTIPEVRKILPENKYTIIQGFLTGPNEQRKEAIMNVQDNNYIYDNHYYHAFDDCSWSCDKKCPKGKCLGLPQCRTCCCDGVGSVGGSNKPIIVGEWSLGVCDMNLVVPEEERDPKFLSNWFVQQKTMFKTNSIGDYFWACKMGINYDPTVYPVTWTKPDWYKPKSKVPANSLIEWDLINLYDNKIVFPFDQYVFKGKCDYKIPNQNAFKYDCKGGCSGSRFGADCGCKNQDGSSKRCC